MALGISLGTQRSGIAIIKGRELVIKEMLYCNPISGRHVQELRRYIKQYSVSAVIIKLPPSTHITAQMNDILRSITTTCKQFGCIIEYANHRSIKGCDMKNQEDIIRKVVSLYPDLLIEQQKQEASKNRYYIKLFEAVLAAHQLLHTNAV